MYCGNCGSKAEEGASFCGQCGSPLASAGGPGTVQDRPVTGHMSQPREAQRQVELRQPVQSRGSSPLLVFLAGILAVVVIALAVLLFAGDTVRAGLGGFLGQARSVPLPTATIGATAVALEVATQFPTPSPSSTSVATARPAVTSPTAAPTAPVTPTKVPPTPSPVPKPPSPTAVPKPTAPALAPAVTLDPLGIRMRPPQGWAHSESVDKVRQGWLSFFAEGGDARTFLFNKPGVFVYQVHTLTSLDPVPAEDLLLAFEDSMVSEYATHFGQVNVTEDPLQPLENAKYSGWVTTVALTGPDGSYKYIWWDISQPGLANTVFCGSSAEMWDNILPICRVAFESIDLLD